MKFAKYLRTPILKNISERLLLEAQFSLLFYCENGVNQYAVQKILTRFWGESVSYYLSSVALDTFYSYTI